MLDKTRVDFRKAMKENNPLKAYNMSLKHLERNPDQPLFQAMAAVAAEKIDNEKALTHHQKAHSLKPKNVKIGRRFALFLVQLGKEDEAREIVKEYIPSDFSDFKPAAFEAQLVPELYEIGGIAAPRAAAQKGTPIEREIRRLLNSASVSEALAEMEKINIKLLSEKVLKRYNRIRDMLVATESVISAYPPELSEKVKQEIENEIIPNPHDSIMSFNANSDTTYVFFAGLTGNASGVPLFHWRVRSLPANIIYMRDVDKNLHMAGIRDVSDDLESSIHHLQSIIESLGTKKLVTVGFSGGSFAAMWYGVSLGASNCKAYGPITSLDEDVIADELAESDARLKKTLAKIPKNMDLRGLIESHPETAIELYYGETRKRDVSHANRLRDITNVQHRLVIGPDDRQLALWILGSEDFLSTLGENVDF